jgi:hypothetical protein
MESQKKNIIILGSGRSGTSMTAGLFSKAGYYMGDRLHKPRALSNPKGFFEARNINDINEELLAPYIPARTLFNRQQPGKNQRWLACIKPGTDIAPTEHAKEAISQIVKHTPFCLKDPRFSYTLPVWQPYLDNVIYLCIYRDPVSTARSIVKECKVVPYLSGWRRGISMSYERALDIWFAMYSNITSHLHKDASWHFIHYEQVFLPETLDRLAQLSNAAIDLSFPERSINTHIADIEAIDALPLQHRDLYRQLNQLSGYDAVV